MRIISRLKSTLSFQDLEKVIHGFITSRLDYCNALYLGLPKSLLARLQMVQNAAARLLTGAKKHDHITPILASLHWLPVSFRIQFNILLIVFKALNGQAPSYISDLISFKSTSKPLRSANKALYMSHGHDLSLKVTVLRLFLFLSLDLKRIFILWPFLNFNLWISIVILDFNLYFILYFTVFYHCFVQHFGQCKLNLKVLYNNLLTYLLTKCLYKCMCASEWDEFLIKKILKIINIV